MAEVTVVGDGEHAVALARQLQVANIGLGVVDFTVPGWYLLADDQGLSLRQGGAKPPGPIRVDFAAGKARHRRLYGGGKGQLLAKAVGLNKASNIQVVDATAGLGGDAFVLASLGCHVTLLERQPVVASLLADGLQRAQNSDDVELREVALRMCLHQVDALHWLQQQAPASTQVVYLDPMYPQGAMRAEVKKEMSAFRKLLPGDDDCDQLLPSALQVARNRVVVKRPRKGEALAGRVAGLQFTGKSSRYDVYTLRGFGPD